MSVWGNMEAYAKKKRKKGGDSKDGEKDTVEDAFVIKLCCDLNSPSIQRVLRCITEEERRAPPQGEGIKGRRRRWTTSVQHSASACVV